MLVPRTATTVLSATDTAEAATWFKRVTKLDFRLVDDEKRNRYFYPERWVRLGNIVGNGWGVEANLPMAYMWLSLAARELPEANKDKEALTARMTAQQIADGELMVADWLAEYGEAWGF